MADFMRAGGVPMWVVLVYGVVALVAAALFAARPDESKIPYVRAMSAAMIFAIIGGVASCIAAVMSNIAADPEMSRDPLIPIMIGIGESLAPAILGFAFLSLIWLVMAAGIRRLARLGG